MKTKTLGIEVHVSLLKRLDHYATYHGLGRDEVVETMISYCLGILDETALPQGQKLEDNLRFAKTYAQDLHQRTDEVIAALEKSVIEAQGVLRAARKEALR